MRPPQQARSRESAATVLRATRRLLAARSFDDVSITEILRQSGHSAGRFYARFSGKEALFEELCRTLVAEERAVVRSELAAWPSLAVTERSRRFVGLVARLATAHRSLHRSLLLRLWRNPGRHAGLVKRFHDPDFDRAVLVALDVGGRARGRRGPGDVRWAIETVADSCRHQFLFGRFARSGPDDVKARGYLAFLARLIEQALVVDSRSTRGPRR